MDIHSGLIRKPWRRLGNWRELYNGRKLSLFDRGDIPSSKMLRHIIRFHIDIDRALS